MDSDAYVDTTLVNSCMIEGVTSSVLEIWYRIVEETERLRSIRFTQVGLILTLQRFAVLC